MPVINFAKAKGAYLGTKKGKKAYIGDELVWEGDVRLFKLSFEGVANGDHYNDDYAPFFPLGKLKLINDKGVDVFYKEPFKLSYWRGGVENEIITEETVPTINNDEAASYDFFDSDWITFSNPYKNIKEIILVTPWSFYGKVKLHFSNGKVMSADLGFDNTEIDYKASINVDEAYNNAN